MIILRCVYFESNKFLENFSLPHTDRAADMHRENMKKKRRELEQASLDAASDLLDTDSNATIPMVNSHMVYRTCIVDCYIY